MADTNPWRGKFARVEILLPKGGDDDQLLDLIAASTGESRATIARAALRPGLRKQARELGIELGKAAKAKGAKR